MNLSPAFLHGEVAFVNLLLGALIGLIGAPLILYIWLWRTKVSASKLSVAYLALMVVLCVVFSQGDLSSTLSMIASGLGFFLSLPWSVLAALALNATGKSTGSNTEFAVLMLVSALINAVLLYLIARKMRRKIE